MKKKWTIFEVANTMEKPVGRLKDWLSRGFIPCSEPAAGQGIAAKFSKTDIYGIGLFAYMVNNLKFNREDAGKIVGDWMTYLKNCGESGNTIAVGPEPDAMHVRFYATELICFYSPDDRGGKSKIQTIEPIALHLATEESRFRNIGEALAKNVAGEAWDSVVVINARAIWEAIDEKLKE